MRMLIGHRGLSRRHLERVFLNYNFARFEGRNDNGFFKFEFFDITLKLIYFLQLIFQIYEKT